MFPLNGYPEFMTSWMKLATAYTEMSVNAGEVIYHRTLRMACGTMTQPEAMEMVMEKATAFASATESATLAAARGGDMLGIATAALRPYDIKTRSNVRDLRG